MISISIVKDGLTLGFIELHVAILLAGFTGVLGRFITLNESLLVFWRVVIAVIAIALIFTIQKKRFALPVKDIVRIGEVGFLLATHWVLFYASIKYANVSVGVVCFASVGFFTAIFDPLMSKRAFSTREIAFSLLTLAGIYLIFHFDTRYQTGIALGIASSIVFAVMSIEKRRISFSYEPMTFVFYELGTCLIAIAAITWFYMKGQTFDAWIPDMSDTLALLFLGLICTVGLQYLNLCALKALSAFTVNLSYNLEPVYSIILAMIIFDEARELNFAFYVGLLFIIVSVILQNVFHARKSEK